MTLRTSDLSGYHNYIGHSSQVPNEHDYAPATHNPRYLMWRGSRDRVDAFTNVCKHRFATLKEQRGNAQNLVCNLHGWTYAQKGILIGTPQQNAPEKCGNLDIVSSIEGGDGFLFATAGSAILDLFKNRILNFLKKHGVDPAIYQYRQSYKEPCDYGWKAFVDTYSENYHVAPFHPGLGTMVDTSAVEWDFFEHGQVAKFGYAGKCKEGLYAMLQQAYKDAPNEPQGVKWFLFYPNLMIEIYPHAMVVSIVTEDPSNPDDLAINYVDFFYEHGVAEFYPAIPAAFEKAYFETAREDDEICRRLHQGRKIYRPDDQFPTFNHLEAGQKHFNEWYKTALGAFF